MVDIYKILFIDDDKEVLIQLKAIMKNHSQKAKNYKINAKYFNFENGYKSIEKTRYHIIVCDIINKNSDTDGKEIIDRIRDSYFCPLIMFSNSSKPDYIHNSPFTTFLSKSGSNEADDFIKAINNMIKTRIPYMVKEITDNLAKIIEKNCSDYTWKYIDENWNDLEMKFMINNELDINKIKEMIKVRVAHKILSESLNNVTAFSYYFVPVEDKNIKLGSIIEINTTHGDKQANKEYGIVLTPHCYLPQGGGQNTKVDHFLIAKCLYQNEIIKRIKNKKFQSNITKLIRIPIAATELTPNGRYCFLPGLPGVFEHLFCDLNDLKTIPLNTNNINVVAELLPPYAEALQAAFTRYYANVGIPNLKPKDFVDLFNE